MEKYIYNEQNGLWYELQGGYYLPCLKLSEKPEEYIGIWGQRHRHYLKTHRKATYTSLLTSGKLNNYLAMGTIIIGTITGLFILALIIYTIKYWGK